MSSTLNPDNFPDDGTPAPKGHDDYRLDLPKR